MSIWGPLHDRYENPKPQRKILALEGGGIRGLITLQFLEKMENDLRKALGKNETFRLSDFFDYIGGTSTGAIIAAGLSLGMSSRELIDFYLNKGKDMFDKNFILKKWKAFYNSGPLEEMLKTTFGEGTNLKLADGKFKSLLLVVTMNRTTDSPWPINNNPKAKYNLEDRPDCNLQIPLYQLVRASTAAPTYFPPETIEWDKNDPSKTFVFVDGGVTPYNNPAFLMYRMATHPAYKLNWDIGDDKLLIVSVGTGSAPSVGSYSNLMDTARNIPNNLMYAMQNDQDINCRTIGRCTYGAPIDRELGNMIPINEEGKIDAPAKPTMRHFLYVRYNADLSEDGLQKLNLGHINSDHVREMDSVKYLKELETVGKAAAAQQVNLEHFENFVQKGAEDKK